MKGKLYFSSFCLGHFLVLFSFLLLQLNIFLPSVISSLISFQMFFTLSLNILFCCLGVQVESSCQRSNFDSFKCLTSPPDFCSVPYSTHALFFLPLFQSFFFFSLPKATEKRFTHLQHPSLPVHLQQQSSLDMLWPGTRVWKFTWVT